MSHCIRRKKVRRQAVAWLMLATTLQFVGADLLYALPNPDYDGTAIVGRKSVALVRGPADTRVNTWNANLMVSRQELYVPSQGIPLDLSLQYNSLLNLENGPFGYGWSFSYGMSAIPQPSGDVLVQWGDGRRDLFAPSGAVFTPVNEGVFSTLASTGPGTYILCTPQQICYRFETPSHGKLTRITEPSGNQVTLAYDSAARLLSVRDVHGFSFLFHYDAQDRVIEVVDSATAPSRVLHYGYNAAGDLVRVEDAMANATTYAYVCPHLLTRITDAVGATTLIDYTPSAQVQEIANAAARSRFAYNPLFLTTSVTERIDATTERTTAFRYDPLQRLNRRTDAAGGITAFGYDGAGNPAGFTSPGGKSTSFTWSAQGDLLTRTNHLGGMEIWSYHPTYHKPLTYRDQLGHFTTMTYDPQGRLSSFTYDGTNFWNYTYDGQGRNTSFTDARGNTSTFNYDAYGNRVAMNPAGGGAPATYAFDTVHRLIRKGTGLGHVTRFEYDARDRLTRMIDPLNGIYAFTYDPLDRTLTFSDPSMRTHTFDRDPFGRLIDYIAPGLATTTYAYDDLSRLIAVTDPGGHATNYTYDSLDRRLSWSDPLGNTTSYTYDGDGNRLTRTDPTTDVTTYTYDGLNRLTFLDQPGIAEDATYEYDADSKMTRAANSLADLRFTYDGVDRMVSASDALTSRILGFTYTQTGERSTMTDPDGGLFSYDYDALDRLTAITDPLNRTTAYTYDAAGRPATLTQPNDTVTTYQHDAANRLLGIDTRRSDNSSVFLGQYTYDAAGNRTSSLENGQFVGYDYDTPGRLMRARFGSGRTIDYTYDADGNRTRLADSLVGTTNYVYDAAERLTSSTGVDAASYVNDDKGNRIARTAGPAVTSYAYNAQNDLTQVTLPGGATTTYTYDALGRRITKQPPGGPATRVDFIRDPLSGSNVVSEYSGLGPRIARYTSAETMNSYLTYEGPGGSLFLHGDRLRTVRAATDPAGTTQASFDYLPYGEPLTSVGSVGDRTFTGAEVGATPDLVHLRNREYDTRTGRFLQRDPLIPTALDPPNFNPYLYVGDSPQTYTDPRGEWFLAVIAVVAVVVIVVAVVGSLSDASDGAKKLEESTKNKDRIIESSRNPGANPDFELFNNAYQENLQGGLKDLNDAATNFPGTTKTQAADVPDTEAKGVVWAFLQWWDSLWWPKNESSKPKVEPQRTESGSQSYNMRGANSVTGVETDFGYAQGGTELSSCGQVAGSFAGPGIGTIYGVAVDPADGTLFTVGENGSSFVNLYHTQRHGSLIGSAQIPFLGGARGVSVDGNKLYVTRSIGSTSMALLMDKTTFQATARWILSGTGNPNPSTPIFGASDLQPTGIVGPHGGQVLLVSSANEANIRTIEVLTDQPPSTSSTWFLLATRSNPTGLPSTALGLGSAGLLTTWGGTEYLQDPINLAVIDSCASPAGPSTYGSDSDPGDGTVWAINPSGDTVDNGGPPGGNPSTDTDGDGVPDGCDNCVTNFDVTQTDSDGDGWGDSCECAPLNQAIHPGAKEICGDGADNDCDGLTDGASPFCTPVPNVSDLTVRHVQPEFLWNPVGGATGYDLIRARRENIVSAGGVISLGPVSCLDLDSPDTQTERDPLIPDVGKAFLYLVRVHHGQAVYGRSTGGLPNVPSSGDCPQAP